eukprot:TRINITY_DN65140_c0_g1_i1.p1 TRINITY_DN65140_c0_g1~~TRINITY_DN65140_c0_g1_i1.p1  ORF type:complete len:572 (+),score=69.34 TRINITY_DN65140_c0_g1_i1:76-1716(+)
MDCASCLYFVLGIMGTSMASSITVTVDWGQAVARGLKAIPTYLDQVNPGTMARSAATHDAVFKRIQEMGADHIRYLHWDPFQLSYPLPNPPIDGKTTWDFSGIDPYVEDFMKASAGHDSQIIFSPMFKWGFDSMGFLDPTGEQAGEYFSRVISWYTKGGFVDELGVKHESNYSYTWKYWEVLNEVDAGESGTKCNSLNNSNAALACVRKYTEIYDGIVTVLKRDHPQLQFTGLVLAFPDCAGSETWFRYFLNASNHRSPVRENFASYVSEISYHWYSENGFLQNLSQNTWPGIGANPADVFVQASQFVSAAARVQRLVKELAPSVRTYVNEVGILAQDPPASTQPFGKDRWWWNLQASHFAYVYGELAALGVDAIAASQLTGYPGNAASISMLDWTNGQASAYFAVVKMFIDTLGSGSKTVVQTRVDGTLSSDLIKGLHPDQWMCIHSLGAEKIDETLAAPIYSQAMVLDDEDGSRMLLLANTRNVSANITVTDAAGGSVRSVGLGMSAYSEFKLVNDQLLLTGFAVAIVRLPRAGVRSDPVAILV